MTHFIQRGVESIIDPISNLLSIQVQLEDMFIEERKPGQKRKASDHSIEPHGKAQKTLTARDVKLEELEELRQERLSAFDTLQLPILLALYRANPKFFHLLSRSLLLAKNDPMSSISLEDKLCERKKLDQRSQILYSRKYAVIQTFQRDILMIDYIFNNDRIEERALDIIDDICEISGEDEEMVTHNLSKSYFAQSPILFFWHIVQFAKSAKNARIPCIEAYTTYKQCRDLIAEAKVNNLKNIIFNNKGLTMLPPEIGELTRLEILKLDNNHLSFLPSEIWQLENLKELSLAYNSFIILPPEIGQLKKLQILDLTGNRLLTLPSEIVQLRGLIGFHSTEIRSKFCLLQ